MMLFKSYGVLIRVIKGHYFTSELYIVGQIYGTVKYGENLWDIDIKNMAVSQMDHAACTA